MDVLKQQILPYLKTDFEKDLLEAALNNLNDSSNKLRLNNFAYAARELTRHFLERLAPDADVRNAPWFVPHDCKFKYECFFTRKLFGSGEPARIALCVLCFLESFFKRDKS